ncbi:hypothetical protein ACVWYF_003905 [Hymenobacter sp. UYAg731]
MQVAIIIPETEWQALLATIGKLEQRVAALEPSPAPPDTLLNVRQAAAYINFTPEGVRKARRAGRLKGVRINEKEWGFYKSELDRYLNRYNRTSMGSSRQLPPLPPIP